MDKDSTADPDRRSRPITYFPCGFDSFGGNSLEKPVRICSLGQGDPPKNDPQA